MNQITTTGIVLSRTDFGEADRIVTLLTPDHGKLRLMAKGVRRPKSKLAGGIELFSVSDITFVRGRGDIGTLVSARLKQHFGDIVRDVQRTMLGYELIKLLNRVTEDEPEEDYFVLLEQSFAALNDLAIDHMLIRAWFLMQLLRLSGHSPNLHTDSAGNKLNADARYEFSFDDVAFHSRPDGHFAADDIKFLRVGFSGTAPMVLQKIIGIHNLLENVTPLVHTMASTYLHI